MWRADLPRTARRAKFGVVCCIAFYLTLFAGLITIGTAESNAKSGAIVEEARAARARGDVVQAARLLAKMATGDVLPTSKSGIDSRRAGLEHAIDLARWVIDRAVADDDVATQAFFALAKCQEMLGNEEARASALGELLARLPIDTTVPGKKTRKEVKQLAVLVAVMHELALSQYMGKQPGGITAARETLVALRAVVARLPQLAQRRSVRRSMLLLLHLESGTRRTSPNATAATTASDEAIAEVDGAAKSATPLLDAIRGRATIVEPKDSKEAEEAAKVDRLLEAQLRELQRLRAPADREDHADGGWSPKTIAAADLGAPYDVGDDVNVQVGSTTRCDIDRHERLSSSSLIKDYVARNRPVIVGGLTDNWAAHQQWQRKAFLEKYGAVSMVAVSSSDATKPFATQELTSARNASVLDYVEEYLAGGSPSDGNPLYTFGGLNASALESDFSVPEFAWGAFDWYPKDKDDSNLPPELREYRSQRRLFYLGGVGSGAQMHAHSGALNSLVYGRKKWWLMPPGVNWVASRSSDSARNAVNDLSTSAWLREHRMHLPPHSVLECTQRANETLFVPEMWAHATLNLKESIGIAFELGHTLELHDNYDANKTIVDWHELPMIAQYRDASEEEVAEPETAGDKASKNDEL